MPVKVWEEKKTIDFSYVFNLIVFVKLTQCEYVFKLLVRGGALNPTCAYSLDCETIFDTYIPPNVFPDTRSSLLISVYFLRGYYTHFVRTCYTRMYNDKTNSNNVIIEKSMKLDEFFRTSIFYSILYTVVWIFFLPYKFWKRKKK